MYIRRTFDRICWRRQENSPRCHHGAASLVISVLFVYFFFVYLFHLFCLFSTINKQTWTQLKSFRLVSDFFYGQYPKKRNPEVLYKFYPFGIFVHSEFCPILNFVHSEFCTILEFLLRDLLCGILSVNGFGFLMNFFFFEFCTGSQINQSFFRYCKFVNS